MESRTDVQGRFDFVDSIDFGTLSGRVLRLVRIWPIFDSIDSIDFGTQSRRDTIQGPKINGINGINGIKRVPISLILLILGP